MQKPKPPDFFEIRMSDRLKKKGFKALGTDIEIQLVVDDEAKKERMDAVFESVREIFLEKERVFSRFDQSSELSALNRKTGQWNHASADMVFLASRALHYFRKSGGLYDPRIIEILEKIGYADDFRKADFLKVKIPQKFDRITSNLQEELMIRGQEVFFARRIDLSGIAKGYVTDCAAKYLRTEGWKNFLVDSGGDMFASGRNDLGEKWKISVEGVPERKLMLAVSNQGIATSGISRKKWMIAGKKFHHLVNPKNPSEYSFELRTVSVIAKNTEEADGRAKTLVLMGKKKGLEFAAKNKIAAVFLDYRGDVFLSPESKKYIDGNV